MQKGCYLVALFGPCIWAGCGPEIVQTAYLPSVEAGPAGASTTPTSAEAGPAGASTTPTSAEAGPDGRPTTATCEKNVLRSRLTFKSIMVTDDIRYKRPGYSNFPDDERIAFSINLRTNSGQVAWLNNAGTEVHVTPLTSDLTRAGDDAVVHGTDLGGLVVHDDGFAVLTRREDPGEPVGPNMTKAQAAFWVRVKNGQEIARPLTGTTSIVEATDLRRDYSPGLQGRLVYNAGRYGANFAIRGGDGHLYASEYSDKLVCLDDQGQFVSGGWSWGACNRNRGIRLAAEQNTFIGFCIQDGSAARVTMIVPALPSQPARVREKTLASEYGTITSTTSYAGAQFGSVLTIPDGYLLGWLSRGDPLTSSSAMSNHDLAWMSISNDHTPGPRRWMEVRTPRIAEINLHLAPYGTQRVLVVWETIENLLCNTLVCYGEYGGTHFRLMDLTGKWVSDEVVIPPSDPTAFLPPNGADDIAVYPNGDLGWALVPDQRSYTGPLVSVNGVPSVPPARQIKVVRFLYCDD